MRGGRPGRVRAPWRRRCRCRRAGGGRARARPSKAHRGGKWGHRSSHGKWSGSHARVARAHLHRLEVRRAARVAPPPRAPRRLLSGAAHAASVSSGGSSVGSAVSGAWWLALAYTALVARKSTRQNCRLGSGDACRARGGSHRNAPPPSSLAATHAGAAHHVRLVDPFVAELEGQRRVVIGRRRARDACGTR